MFQIFLNVLLTQKTSFSNFILILCFTVFFLGDNSYQYLRFSAGIISVDSFAFDMRETIILSTNLSARLFDI